MPTPARTDWPCAVGPVPVRGRRGRNARRSRELLAKYGTEDRRRERVLAELHRQIALLPGDNERRLAEQFATEINADADSDAIGRLASFERLADDPQMSADRKVALAISGWLVGANQATDNLQVAISLAGVRDKVREYLRDPNQASRNQIAAELRDMEGASVERVAQILKLMKPPLDAPSVGEASAWERFFCGRRLRRRFPVATQAVIGLREPSHS